jgi:Arc/MetJ family transcription regulator
MKTTLDLDRKLLARAKKVLGAESYTEAIETALRDVVARAEARTHWESLIGADLSWTSVEELLEYRRRYGGRSL